MAEAISTFRKNRIIETFKEVKSIRSTSLITKTSRNTVKKVLNSLNEGKGFNSDIALNNDMRIASENLKELNKLPLLNPKSKWNPSSSELYKCLSTFQSYTRLEPGSVEYLTNTALLMSSLANELNIGNSVAGTLKLELLMRSYIDYHQARQRVVQLRQNECGLTPDKFAKTLSIYKDLENKAYKIVIEALSELEGKNNHLSRHIQNNFNVNLGSSSESNRSARPTDIEGKP